MRLYKNGEFVENEASRRSLRDQSRDQFFAALGVERTKDPFACDPDPGAQLALVKTLIDETLSVHNVDRSALLAVQSLVTTSALGIPSGQLIPGVLGRPAYQGTTVASYLQRHFRFPGSQ
ncbi:hypothetical protein OSJ77_03180 [Phyllobacterium sp. 0TCS1.6C]|uniref:hypothetical protein n=1 Tax=unclassified Phyllobacterium TaxID=2638441 RepID=UPI0022641FEE|nr:MULTISPECIES: hypothetical protein [unclassified Phyllobacterium]MCX8279182.1 hypothetical protein [Phyllobacterium sp. 0TCS1.6C]MCX8293966.1 hypothetical protein [Phyllobacterium sp. 0TCS1.6A]